MNQLYNMIVKRKSFRQFDDTLILSEEELQDINEKIESLNQFVNKIEIKYKIVPRKSNMLFMSKLYY